MPTPTPIPDGAGEKLLGFFERAWVYIRDESIKLWEGLPIFIVNVALCFLVWLLAKWTIRILSDRLKPLLSDDYKGYKNKTIGQIHRIRSIATLTRSVLRYGIYLIAISICISVLEIGDAKAIIAGAGVGSVALAFGAQNLVKDVISGLFMVFENQYSVGDYVRLSTPPGIVEGYIEAVALRVTYMRDVQGRQYIIPNGTIDQVINCTRGDWLAIVDVSVAYEEDAQLASEVLHEVAKEVALEMPDNAAGEPEIRAIEEFQDSGVRIRVVCPAKPTKQWALERRIRLRAKEKFDELGIEIPYSKTVVLKQEPAPANKRDSIERYITAQRFKHPDNNAEDRYDGDF